MQKPIGGRSLLAPKTAKRHAENRAMLPITLNKEAIDGFDYYRFGKVYFKAFR
jgi:hypothetical protein